MTAMLAFALTPPAGAAGSGNELAIIGMIVSAVAAAAAIWAALHAKTQANMAQSQAGDAQRSADAAKDQAVSAREQVEIGKEQLELAKRDREEADKQWEQDRADADRRLREERAAADKRLQQQLDEQRERDRRRFIAEQLQKAASLWAEGERWQLVGVLPAIPDQYASILRYMLWGEDYQRRAGVLPLSQVTREALERQLTAHGLEHYGENYYLIKKRELEERNQAEGKSKDWSSHHPRARELYKLGWDYTKVKPDWLYQEIGENIAEVLGREQQDTERPDS
jgi:hypothetical protein